MIEIPESSDEYTTNFLKGICLFLNKSEYRGVVMSPEYHSIEIYLANIILTKEENRKLKMLGWLELPECTWKYPSREYWEL